MDRCAHNGSEYGYGIVIVNNAIPTSFSIIISQVGTFEIAKELASQKMFTCIHKHYSVEEWQAFGDANSDLLPYLAVSSGVRSVYSNYLFKKQLVV